MKIDMIILLANTIEHYIDRCADDDHNNDHDDDNDACDYDDDGNNDSDDVDHGYNDIL
jgi:hypothetical protein